MQKFSAYAKYNKIVFVLYSMILIIHKILIHGPKIIENILLLIE